MPQGTPVVFAGGRQGFPSTDDAKTYGDAIWRTLDRVRANVADMVLVHGGDGKGADRLAASWAERHKVPQISFSLDTRLGARAGFRRNEQMLGLKPRYVVAFAGNGVLERLVIQAKERGIAVVDRRGPLGTNPKRDATAQTPRSSPRDLISAPLRRRHYSLPEAQSLTARFMRRAIMKLSIRHETRYR